MSTLRINNIEAQSVPASPTIDEKVKVTNSSGDILVNIDGKTSGITTIGINTTDGNIKFDANSNVLITGILTATTLAGNFTPDSLEVGSNIKLGNAGVITATSFVGSGANLTGLTVPGGGTGLDLNDGVKIRLGTGNDMEFHHTSGDNIINYINGNLIIKKGSNSNSNSIQFDGNGHMYVPDDDSVYFGSSGDLNISHRSSDESAVIKNFNDTGFLRLLSGDSNSSGILLKNRDDDVTYLRARNEQEVELYYANSKKFETISYGVLVTGECRASGSFQLLDYDGSTSGYMKFGYGDDMKVYHNGTDSYISNSTNKLRIGNSHNDSIKFFTQGSTRWNIDGSGHFIPDTTNQVDIGSTSYRVRNIYTMDLHCSNKGSKNDVDGTWGDYTIQEGESDLFLINNRSGKKYKFNLTEVN